MSVSQHFTKKSPLSQMGLVKTIEKKQEDGLTDASINKELL